MVWLVLKEFVRHEAKPLNKYELLQAIVTFQRDRLTKIACNKYIDNLQKVFPVVVQRNGGKHILQKRYRCELDGDGSRRGSIQYLFDGDDFFSLDLTTGTWTAANARAENFITEWDPKEHQAKHWKNYLNNNCIETLMQYVQYRTNTEERKGTHTLQYITDITTKISYTVGDLDG
ncbi:major histocompatibility complex class I-related gene protein-like [Clarias gariepinus]|uniref:major histocompatibility complex class I-related gene protein-like n=1 Tax=Clarias gariepinus TaxID=13013 RepID=UPI00234C69A5|nr:major histocompatibility complex class I-related gene protein-like [Clarias gariepinus]